MFRLEWGRGSQKPWPERQSMWWWEAQWRWGWGVSRHNIVRKELFGKVFWSCQAHTKVCMFCCKFVKCLWKSWLFFYPVSRESDWATCSISCHVRLAMLLIIMTCCMKNWDGPYLNSPLYFLDLRRIKPKATLQALSNLVRNSDMLLRRHCLARCNSSSSSPTYYSFSYSPVCIEWLLIPPRTNKELLKDACLLFYEDWMDNINAKW